MTQKNITGHAYRVLTDSANDEWHKISLWTHADDVEMENGNNLTLEMKNKFDFDGDYTLIRNVDEIPMNTVGFFTVDTDVGSIVCGSVTLYSGYPYTFASFQASVSSYKFIMVYHFATPKMLNTPMYVLRKAGSGWTGFEVLTDREGALLRHHTDEQIAILDQKKYGIDESKKAITTLDDIEMNTAGSVIVTASTNIGYHEKNANITTTIMPGEYVFFSYENRSWHKFIVMFSNTTQESNLPSGGGYLCTNSGAAGAPWIITRIISPIDFSSDESGLREQIVTSLTGQLWPVGAVYINLTKQNPGDFLGGTWNLITQGILTAIAGSVEQVGYHQRDLYKAVKDEDRGEHLYGVFVWQRIA